jgi:hypothetical protein
MRRTCVSLALALISIGGCGSDSANLPADSRLQLSSNDFDARLASDGKNLWLAKTESVGRSRFRTRVFRLDGTEWSPLGFKGFASSTDEPLLLAVAGGRVCVGYSSPIDGSTIRCFRHTWKEITIGRQWRGFSLRDLVAKDGDLVTLLTKIDSSSTEMRVADVHEGSLTPRGNPVDLRDQVLANFGQATMKAKSPNIDIGLENTATGHRWVATLHKNGWSHTPVFLAAIGPQLSGPVRFDGRIIVPIVNAIRKAKGRKRPDWAIDLASYQETWGLVRGSPLNVGGGSAQGSIDAVGNEAWVTWTQMNTEDLDRGRSARTSVFASRVNSAGSATSKPILLWRGRAAWPGQTQAVEYRGDPVFLYMRGVAKGKDLRATVKFGRGLPRFTDK